MGIKVEFNPDLALRNYSEYELGKRKLEECIPKNLADGMTYSFLKREQRNYWLLGEIPLLETSGNQNLSKPLASIVILESTHYVQDGEVYTKGKYLVKKIFHDDKIHFNGFARTE